jgi:hypothetical protein
MLVLFRSGGIVRSNCSGLTCLFWSDVFWFDVFWFDVFWFDVFWFDVFWAGHQWFSVRFLPKDVLKSVSMVESLRLEAWYFSKHV